jgi:periplasmic divalent cation tolerance protein
MDYSIVMTTCASRADGETLAMGIVRNKLANSVQITEVSSVQEWEGEFQKANEFLLLIKGPRNLFPQLKEYLLANHTYEVPEILQLNITNGNPTHYAYTLGG